MSDTRLTYDERQVAGITLGEIWLDSDSGVNPLSGSTVRAMRERLRGLALVGGPHAVTVSARGRCFCAGADVKEFRRFDEAAFRDYMTEILAMYADLIEVGKPIISVVHADARGGGAALAFCSDFVVAADSARFALPEAHRGLAGGGYLMPRLIGKHRAAEMVLLGRDFSAADMLAMGLVNAVCAAPDLAARTEALVAELARIPASAFAVGKRSLAGGLSVGLREAMAWHVQAQADAFMRGRAEGRAG